jgi:two-component system, NarL family, sensor histidine kinase DevS
MPYQALEALHRAALLVASERDLPHVLQHIVDGARELVGAQYAALGVPNEDGRLHTFIYSGLTAEQAHHMGHLPLGRGLLGAIIHEQTSIRLPDLTQDPRSVGFPAGHPPMTSFLGVPLTQDGKSLGNLYLTNKLEAAEFSPYDQQLVEMLAAHAGVAICKAQFYEADAQQQALLARRNKQLLALSKAARAISAKLNIDTVLQIIVDETRGLIGAQYAALAVPSSTGQIETFVFSGLADEEARKMAHLPIGEGLFGHIIHGQKSFRVADMATSTHSGGFPAYHPPMTSFLGVPIWGANQQVVGTIYLTNKLEKSEFTEHDQTLVEMIAAHAAVAIQNAHLYERVEQLAVLEERTRIGMDLHDGVIQSIYAVGLTLETTRMVVPPAEAEAHLLLDTAVNALNDAIKDIRNYILDLRPRRFQGDLGEGMRQLVREFQANAMVPVDFQAASGLERLPFKVARSLFLITQEALANIARHAKASQVWVDVAWRPSAVALMIRDNGRGFDPQDKTRRVGHGLANMPQRTRDLGGEYHIQSAPNNGTTVTVDIPLRLPLTHD